MHEPEEHDEQLPEDDEIFLSIPLIPKVETHFSILSDPHEGQIIFIFLFTGMISSNLLWHCMHLNSYIGIVFFSSLK